MSISGSSMLSDINIRENIRECLKHRAFINIVDQIQLDSLPDGSYYVRFSVDSYISSDIISLVTGEGFTLKDWGVYPIMGEMFPLLRVKMWFI